MTRTTPPDAPVDPRARAFLTPGGPEVFHAVAHWNEIWRPDPFDVASIHEEAREVFRRLVARAGMSPRPAAGRILLLMGESGSGKTHLMRAFRNWLHSGRRGYCGYMQMTSAADDYGRYVLNNLIDSLCQPYYEPHGASSGLKRLSTALAESSPFIPSQRLAQLREDEIEPECLARLIDALADQIVEDQRFNDCDIELVRALLYLQRDEPGLRGRILKYLRCEALSPADSEFLGGLKARNYPAAAERLVGLLGQIMGSIDGVPLVLCLDQLEAIWNLDDYAARFRRAMATVCDLIERVPSCVVVVSCLEDFYDKMKAHLARPVRARIEDDPKPIKLTSKREVVEVERLIAARLEALFEPHGVAVEADDPTYPIPRAKLPELVNLPTRLILDWCREYRDECVARGRVDVGGPVVPTGVVAADPAPDVTRLEQLWNDARTGSVAATPTDDAGLARLLAGSIAACSEEVGGGHTFAAEADGTMVVVAQGAADRSTEGLLVGVCNKSARGGALGKQVEVVEKRAAETTPAARPVLVRSSEYPTSPAAVVTKQIGGMLARGGRRVVVEDSDWRAMQAMRHFREARRDEPGFATWLARGKPLTRLKSLREVLGLDDPRPAPPGPPTPTPPPAPVPPPVVAAGPTPGGWGPLVLGTTTGIKPEPVTLEPADLVTHAAFLGASGSGKTTLALSIVEQLLARGVPAVLIDRKGDLCRYADPAAWAGAATDGWRASLRERVEVAVFTPGHAEGRPLSIAAVPPGLGVLKSAEREKTAQFAAAALGGMMGYRATGGDQVRTVILAKAMDLLAQARPDGAVTLPELVAFIADSDPALVHAIGLLDTKNFTRLVQDLETIRHSRGDLLCAAGEPLDAEALLGLGAHARPGKTRLSVVSTKFLGPGQDVQFWVAQFLMEMARWTSRAPSRALQAVVLFDEADLYLPAVGKPPTKEPMENLLKRARSAGLGLLLATQSPGDFDYKCRENIGSWFLGRITQGPALAKMRPMLSECRTDVESRLPNQTTGQFQLARAGEVTPFRADPSLLTAEQLAEADILALARRTKTAAGA